MKIFDNTNNNDNHDGTDNKNTRKKLETWGKKKKKKNNEKKLSIATETSRRKTKHRQHDKKAIHCDQILRLEEIPIAETLFFVVFVFFFRFFLSSIINSYFEFVF